MKKETLQFILLLFVFILTRVLVLSSSGSVNWNAEECYIGTIANEIAHGTKLQWYEMPFAEYQLGGVIDAYLSSLFYTNNFLEPYAIKILPLLYATVCFILFYIITHKFYSRFIAVTSAILFIFSSNLFIRWNLINGSGDFLSLTMYTLIIFYVFLKISKGKDSTKWWVLLGLFLGFGFVVNYACLLMLPIVLGYLLANRKSFLPFTSSFFLGTLPFWVFQLFYNNIKEIYLIYAFSNLSLTHFIFKLKSILFKEFIRSFHSNFYVINYAYFYLFIISFVICLIILMKPMKKNFFQTIQYNLNLIVPIIFILLFFIIYSLTKFGDYQRRAATESSNAFYYLVTYPFFFILISTSGSILLASKGRISRILGVTIIIVSVLLGIISLSELINQDELFSVQYQPYCYKGAIDLCGKHCGETPKYFSSPGQIFFFRYYNQKNLLPKTYLFQLCKKMSTQEHQEECTEVVRYYFNKVNMTLPHNFTQFS